MQKLYTVCKNNIKIENIRNYFSNSDKFSKKRMKKSYKSNVRNRESYMIRCSNVIY